MMKKATWCEHSDKTSKYTTLQYDFGHKTVTMRVQSWFCPECGLHGAETEVLSPEGIKRQTAG